MRLSRAISFGRCRVRRRSTAVGERGFASGLSPGRGATLRQPLRCAGNVPLHSVTSDKNDKMTTVSYTRIRIYVYVRALLYVYIFI